MSNDTTAECLGFELRGLAEVRDVVRVAGPHVNYGEGGWTNNEFETAPRAARPRSSAVCWELAGRQGFELGGRRFSKRLMALDFWV
jgi:hypothetical protein